MILSLNTDVKEYPLQDSFFTYTHQLKNFVNLILELKMIRLAKTTESAWFLCDFFKSDLRVFLFFCFSFFPPYFSSNLCTLVYAFNGK